MALPDGEIKEYDRKADDRRHEAFSVETLASLAESVSIPSCWYSRDGVTLFFDDEERFDSARLSLSYSPQMVKFQELEAKQQPIPQRDLIHLLRTTFKDCGPVDLVKSIRQINWDVRELGHSAVERGKASIGKSITQEVSGLVALPEYVTFSVPVFASKIKSIQPVVCLLDPDEQSKGFKLVPLPGKVEEAITAAETDILVDLKNNLPDNVPIYYGRP